MKKTALSILVLGIAILAGDAVAQAPTDFSGRWVLPAEAARGAGPGGGGGGGGGGGVGRGGGGATGGGAAAGGATGAAATTGAAAGGGAAGRAAGGGAPGRAGGGGGGGGAQGRGGGRGADMGSGWGPDITIAQDASKLTLTYAFFGRGDMQPPIKFVYNLNGSESRNTVMMGRGIEEYPSKAVWDGAKLVITTAFVVSDPSVPSGQIKSETKQSLSLESPTVLPVETTRSGVMGGAASATQTRYNKM